MTNKRFLIRRDPEENRSHDLKNSRWPTQVFPFLVPCALTPQFRRLLTNNVPNYPRFISAQHTQLFKMNGQDYDEIRNMTLLFFFDRLMDKGQPRTLHDLSCQFGTKGFTREMRQIAGGSQAGLRKFLSQYPSLFTIDGDHVTLTNYSNVMNNTNGGKQVSGRRDYSEEAVEYFRDKLAMYGIAEVPIKSLLGHRSQATPEVRHISGQHVREFKDFLQKFPEVFVVKDEHVLLRKNLEALQNSGQISSPDAPEYETVDPQLMNELLMLFTNLIQIKGPMTVDHLFGHLSTQMSREVWQKLVKCPQDVATFLRMHSNIFLVQSNMVTLITPQITTQVSPHTVSISISPSGGDNMARITPLNSQSFKQRVMSHVLKAVAENTAMEQNRIQIPVVETDAYPELNQFRILKSVRVVTKSKDSAIIVKQLMSSSSTIISLDGEGVNLGPSGPMTLLQIGTWEGQVYLFDIVSNSELITEGGLQSILESEAVVKVVHDCRNDSGALYHQFGVTLRNVFDTQAAHAIIQLQQTGKPVYKVKNISLNTLCKMYGGPVNPKKDQMKKVYRRDQKFWSRRPLTEEMIVYASYDVLALLPTVYEAMNGLLLPAFMPLFLELCHEQITTYIYVDEVKQKKRTRKIETEVADLKAKLAMATTKQIVLSNREIRLLRYLELSDEEREKLEGSYKVARKLERLQGKNSEGGSVQSAGDSETSPENGADNEELNDEYEEEEDDVDSTEESGGKTSPDSPFHRSNQVISPANFGNWQYVDEYFANGCIETIFGVTNMGMCCRCNCHRDSGNSPGGKGTDITSENVSASSLGSLSEESKKLMSDASCQTLSTGDIVITRVFFDEHDSHVFKEKSGGNSNVKD